jgi:xanthine dehydrogenase accessory factor
MDSQLDIYRRLLEDTGPVVVATVVSVQGSTPGKLGFKMLIYPDGRKYGTVGGGFLEEQVIAAALEVLEAGIPVLKEYSLTEDATGMWCGGAASVLLEPHLPPATLWIFGYGNLGAEVYALLGGLPFRAVVIHDQQIPGVNSTVIDWEKLSPFPEVKAADYVVLLTLDAERELEIVTKLAAAQPRYLGVVGSRTKAAKLRAALEQRDIDVKALNLHCPVGLDIGSKTAKEIAISIVAELIRENNAG